MGSLRRFWSPKLAVVLVLAVTAVSCSSDSTTDGTESSPTEAPVTTAAESTTTSEAPTEPEPEEADVDEPAVADFAAVTEEVEAFVESRGLEGAGLIVVHEEGGVLYEEYFGTFTPDRISMIASASKMISAGVLLRLQDDGLLDIDAPVEGVVDWAVGNPDITPAQLISNSSGLVGLGPNILYGPYLCQWGVPNTLQECGEAVFSSSDDDADQVPPDSEFRYGGAQWQVAGAVAEAVSGTSWDRLIDEIYVEPCEVDSLGYISLGAVPIGPGGYPVGFGGDPSGVTPSANPSVEGGAHITVSDYGKLLLMHLRGGKCGDDQVLSQASLDTMHADRISAVYDGDASAPDTGYGMGWWVDRDTGRISDPGAWGAVPWLDLDDRYGAYLVVEDQAVTGQALKDQIEDLVHEAAVGAQA
ncbi:MAG: serine hydrolase domain-containing protein [Acidimicrobiales bacterium]